jgi:integrase
MRKPTAGVISVTSSNSNSNTKHHESREHDRARDTRPIAPRTPPHTASADRRRSYLTHTAEAGRDPAWRQRQAGHKLMSTTSVYTHTSEDFMNREMAAAIADLTGKRGSET